MRCLSSPGWRQMQRVLDVGCGVATTAIEVARRFGCHVTAVDIDPLMLTRASANVRASGVDTVVVAKADIQALEFADHTFDRVLIEAVTMFVDRRLAVGEVVRVCRPGGRVLDLEFIYRRSTACWLRPLPRSSIGGGRAVRLFVSADRVAVYWIMSSSIVVRPRLRFDAFSKGKSAPESASTRQRIGSRSISQPV